MIGDAVQMMWKGDKKVHQFLLAVLGNEDDYVDVSTLMLKITNYH